MDKSKVGPIVTAVIMAGVALIFFLNRQLDTGSPGSKPPTGEPQPKTKMAGEGREFPIGDDTVKNHMTIAAVWVNSVAMAGMPKPTDDVIHVEADIHATANNPNGFAKDEFIPYLKVQYDLVDATSGKSLQSGEFSPMIAADGLHYGANIVKPAPGNYRLIYKLQPPSAGGLGRHTDSASGVAAWWEPFEATFDWSMSAADGVVSR